MGIETAIIVGAGLLAVGGVTSAVVGAVASGKAADAQKNLASSASAESARIAKEAEQAEIKAAEAAKQKARERLLRIQQSSTIKTNLLGESSTADIKKTTLGGG